MYATRSGGGSAVPPLLILLAAVCRAGYNVDAFAPPPRAPAPSHRQLSHGAAAAPTVVLRSTTAETTTASSDEAFSAFADSLEENELFDEEEEGQSSSSGTGEGVTTWQESLEALLAPDTPAAKRQIVLSDLLNANDEIRDSVQTALRQRTIDPLLTPTGKKLQDGTRAVARQIASDILPGLAAAGDASRRTQSPAQSLAEVPTLVPKIGSRILNAIGTQTRKNLETLQGDLADPTRIPSRIQKQTADIATEAKNIFLETPEGLEGPAYTVVSRGDGYEIREYEGYAVASTSMSKVDEPYSLDDVASGGAAFNALAAYLFGANDEGKVMEMTTPVTTTSLGEMRFYLRPTSDGGASSSASASDFPLPVTEEDDKFNSKGAVSVVDVPPARLAVARFAGFATEGEVARQKDALLAGLAMDGVEIDVPHGAVVPHVVFQYNPPYTIPIVRRNEIGVPVRKPGVVVEAADLEKEWEEVVGGDDLAPSDVESEA